MPFTLFLLRVAGICAILLLVAAALNLQALMQLFSMGVVLTVLLALPIFVVESLGLLSRAAQFFFGERR